MILMSEVIVVTSGKGGVGKTTLTANIGAGISALGFKTVLIDLDIGLRNLDAVMGLENRITYHLMDIIEGNCRINQAFIKDKYYKNLYLIPSSQKHSAKDLLPDQFHALLELLRKEFDYIIIDSPAGIEHGFHNAIFFADRAVVVTTPDISSVRDADKVIRIMKQNDLSQIHLVINKIIPEMIYYGDMLSPNDISEILNQKISGVIPNHKEVMISYNQGTHLIHKENYISKAFMNLCGRITGDDIPITDFNKKVRIFTKLSYKFYKK